MGRYDLHFERRNANEYFSALLYRRTCILVVEIGRGRSLGNVIGLPDNNSYHFKFKKVFRGLYMRQ